MKSPVRSYVVLLAILVVPAAGCGGRGTAAATRAAPGPSEPLREFLAAGFEGGLAAPAHAGEPWEYPELVDAPSTGPGAPASASVENAWAAHHPSCGADHPYQSPVVIMPAIARAGGLTLASLSSPSYALTLGPDPSVHDHAYAFEVPRAGAPTLAYTVEDTTLTVTPFAFHFHAPAEHVVLGAGAPAVELHVKATATRGSLTYVQVFAVQFVAAPSAPSLAWLDPVADVLAPETTASFELGRILELFVTRPSYSYIGGLTTPPCALAHGRITWFVLAEPVPVRASTLARIAAGVERLNGGRGNARTPQPWSTTGPDARTLVTVNAGP